MVGHPKRNYSGGVGGRVSEVLKESASRDSDRARLPIRYHAAYGPAPDRRRDRVPGERCRWRSPRLCIDAGRFVSGVAVDARTIDARGMVVMPGGVDIHAHVAGGSVNLARRLLPEEHRGDPARAPALEDEGSLPRSGTGGTVPSTFTTGYRYAGLGYTTVFDAAVAPGTARLSHAELDDTPIVDGGFFVLMGNDEYLLRLVAADEREQAREYAAWLLGAAGGYAIKIVNPGGVELWKRGSRDRTDLDSPIGSTRVTPRAILELGHVTRRGSGAIGANR